MESETAMHALTDHDATTRTHRMVENGIGGHVPAGGILDGIN